MTETPVYIMPDTVADTAMPRPYLYAVALNAFNNVYGQWSYQAAAGYVLASDASSAAARASEMARELWPNAQQYGTGICLIPDNVILDTLTWQVTA